MNLYNCSYYSEMLFLYKKCSTIFTSFTVLALFHTFLHSHSLADTTINTNTTTPPLLLSYGDKCGNTFNHIPFPFHLNSNDDIPDVFRLTCVNSTTLFLTIGSLTYQVLHFYPDAVLVDFPNTTSCRQYNDLKSFGFEGNSYFGISIDNVVGLYDCEDSSLCKSDCEKSLMPGCHDNSAGAYPACCYPLSDRSAWRVGDGFSGFSEFGCRGFSCWVENGKIGKRGVKLEWGIPLNSTTKCALNAELVNATTVPFAMRCQCLDGFVGDGFTQGTKCLQSCIKDGKEAYGDECYTKRHNRKKVVLLAGLLTSAFSVASLTALLCVLKRPTKSGTFSSDRFHGQSTTISFRKPCRTRSFSYHELEIATKGFDDAHKLMSGTKGTLYAGTLGDGSRIVVQKVHSGSESDLIQVSSQLEVLSSISHRSMACLLGWSINSGSGYTPLVVYEYPANGTLEEHLRETGGLSWYKRLQIAAETASVLAFLQCEISPPLSHHDLRSGCILLDEDLSVKIAGFGLLEDGSNLISRRRTSSSSDVYNMGVILLEMIAGSRVVANLPTIALQKIRIGKLEEIVDPMFYQNEQQQSLCKEQIEKVVDVAMRCLLFGGDQGKLGIIDVARELVHITKENGGGEHGGSRRGGPALEETFSNSSLLQMISMSPDSIYNNVPK